MTPAAGIKFHGGEDLAETFRGLARSVQGDALEAATRAAALPILNQARLTEHEGGHTPYLSGTLRRSIHMETTRKSPARCTVAIGTDVPYARRLEYGFFDIDSLGRLYNQIARPYLRPAFDENVEASQGEFRAAMRDIVGRYAHAATA